MLQTGIKVIGGVKEQTGEEFGVYVKRILPGGVASYDGKSFDLGAITDSLDPRRGRCFVREHVNKESHIFKINNMLNSKYILIIYIYIFRVSLSLSQHSL